MKPARSTTILAAAALLVAAATWLFVRSQPPAVALPDVGAAANPEELRSAVARLERSARPEDLEDAARARVRLAYHASKRKDFAGAREVLLPAARAKSRSDLAQPAFGRPNDQAAYQAAVCLVALGNKREAEAEFRRFIRERPESPLVYACIRRLTRLNGGEPKPEDEALMQKAIGIQEERARREIVSCGPKALLYLVSTYFPERSGGLDLERATELCSPGEDGATMEGLRQALSRLGLSARGVRLNRADFAWQRAPALWLRERHYYVLANVMDDFAYAYDPTAAQVVRVPLPDKGDAEFVADLLVFDAERTLGRTQP